MFGGWVLGLGFGMSECATDKEPVCVSVNLFRVEIIHLILA